VLAILFLVLPLTGWAVGAYLVTGDPLQPADAIVLLAGGDEQRLQSAVSLYQQRLAGTFLLTETGERVGDSRVTMTEQTRLALIAAGVASDAIWVVPDPATSTFEEAGTVREALLDRKLRSAIIVTDPYHTRRTRLIYRRAFADSELQAIVRPVQGHWYRPSTWFLRPAGWQATILELVKLVNDAWLR
jgi:uncharacterized SAM-binding protein YcdF (DUF218 family)